MSKTKRAWTVILSVLVALTLAVIWGNSLLSKESSAAESAEVHGALSGLLDYIFGEGVITVDVLRKLAHFFEFFILGAEVCFLVFVITGLKIKPFLIILPAGLVVAATDELLQFISKRGPSVTDVVIDFSGYASAFCIFALVILIRYLSKRKRKPE